MDIQTKKLEFITEFLRLGDEALIDKLLEMLYFEKQHKVEGKLTRLSEVELEEMIAKAELEAKNGEIVSANVLLKNIDEWK